ncbi:MAG: hypothetical protein WC250_00220 [Candidatus Paceibacterota bacterium]|jgi:hypothetical protein
MNKKIASGVVGALVLGGIIFYGGVAYGKTLTPARGQFDNGQMSAGANNFRGVNGLGNRGGGSAFGEVITKDSASLSIKLQDGSTKLILLGTSTPVSKTSAGSLSDILVGVDVGVGGTTNTDGSISAKSIQLLPQLPARAKN